MKRLMTSIVAATALLFAGCMTTNEYGEKEFSEARTRAAVDPAVGLISLGVMVGSMADKNTESGFRIALSVIESALNEGVIDKEEIIRRLDGITINGIDPNMNNVIVRRLLGSALNWYGILEDEVLQRWLNDPGTAGKCSLIFLEAIRDGIRDGLPPTTNP